MDNGKRALVFGGITMKKLISVLLLCVVSFAYAGVDEGVAAYQKGNYTIALKEFKKAAQQGDAYAQFNLGLMYYEGEGVPQDYAKAMSWYLKAAEQGNASAQYSLGLMYADGRGVPQDDSQAVVWYTKAAEQGYAMAQSNLGAMYAKGEGVPQNYKIAYILFNLAASKGGDSAVKNRDMVLNTLTPADRADAQRISTRLYNSKNFAADLRKLLKAQ